MVAETQNLSEDYAIDVGKIYRELAPLFNRDVGRCAILVIDLTKEYVDPDPSKPLDAPQNEMDKAVESTRYLLGKMRQHFPYIPQVFVADQAILGDLGVEEDNQVRGEICKKALQSMSREEALSHYVPLGQKPEDAVFLKSSRDAFSTGFHVETGQGLADFLRSKNIDNLIVCGTTITQCVRETAEHAKRDGFKPLVLSECVAGGLDPSRLRKYKAEAMEEFGEKGIHVLSVFELLQSYKLNPEPLKERLDQLNARELLQPPGLMQRMATSLANRFMIFNHA